MRREGRRTPGSGLMRNLVRMLAAPAVLGLMTAPGTAQAPDSTRTPDSAQVAPELPGLPAGLDPSGPAAAYRRVAAITHPHGTMVGMALQLPVGSAQDPAGAEGTTALLVQALAQRAGDRLGGQGVGVGVEVNRSRTVFTVLAPPESWRDALARLHRLLFDQPLSPAWGDRVLGQALESLRFQAQAPVETFEREAAALLVDGGSSWATPIRGTLESVAGLTANDLETHRARFLNPGTALLGLAGPLQAPDVDPTRAAVPGAGAAPGRAADSLPAGATGPAWRVGDRASLVREVTSSWLSVAYPVDPTLPRTSLELLAHLLLEELDPVPPDAARYSVDVELVDPPGGPVLRVTASLLPEALDRWEARVLETVRSLATNVLEEDFFRWRRRRFRAQRLLAEAAPEVQAARLTHDLAHLGHVRELDAEVWSLGPASVAEAARALGEPRILRFGPDLAQDPDGPAR